LSYATDIERIIYGIITRNAASRAALWLIANIRVYLTGFSKRRKQPKVRKDSQKCGGEKHELRAFTISALSMISAYAKGTFA
jgi:hypothetical protein